MSSIGRHHRTPFYQQEFLILDIAREEFCSAVRRDVAIQPFTGGGETDSRVSNSFCGLLTHRMNTNSENSLRIRPIEPSHIADLIRIGEETNLSHWSAQSYLDEMKNPDSVMLRLVSSDNSTIGFIVGRFVMGGEIEACPDAEIYNIAVTEEEQRKGFGQFLFNAFIATCVKKKAANIWLEVRESKEKAISFYKKNGFASIQTRPFFYENPREHALLMKLDLGSESA